MSRAPGKPRPDLYGLHLVRGGYELLGGAGRGGFSPGGQAWIPAADVCDAVDRIIIRLEVAGIDRHEISLLQRGREITVHGQRLRDADGAQHCYHLVEIPAGPFERRFDFPDAVNLTEVEASYCDGILRIVLRKAPRAPRESRFLKIHVEEKA